MKVPYGNWLFAVHFIVDVSVLAIIIMQIGPLSPLFQVSYSLVSSQPQQSCLKMYTHIVITISIFLPGFECWIWLYKSKGNIYSVFS